jgi:hypothetical protein
LFASSQQAFVVRAGSRLHPCLGSPFRYLKGEDDAIADEKKKKIGRPSTGIGPNVGLRLYPEMDAAIEAWIAKQRDPKPSKPEAIRRLVALGLAVTLRG